MSDLELRQLEYFVAVAEHLHFGRAAEALLVGQPAISQQIARLERTLGVVLFDRTSRRVTLTEAGRRLLPPARAALVAVERARESVAPNGPTPPALLRLGASSGMGSRLDDFVTALQQVRPGTPVEFSHAPARSRVERVAAGQLDAAFVRSRRVTDGVELIEVWVDRLVAALPADHPYAQRRSVGIGELAQLPLRIVARRRNPDLVELVLSTCASAGFAPHCVWHDGGPVESVLASLRAGTPTWTVLYDTHAQVLRTPEIVFVATDPELALPMYLAVAKDASSRAIAPLLAACAAVRGG